MESPYRKLFDKTKKSPVAHVLRRRKGNAPVAEGGGIVKVPTKGIVTGLLKGITGEVNTFRDNEHIHVSTLLTKCIRKIAISETYNAGVPAKAEGDSTGLVYAQGRAIQQYVSDIFCKGHPSKMFGVWVCICGGTTTDPMVKEDIPRISCPSCGKVPSIYKEMELKDDEWILTGAPDIVLYLQEHDCYHPIEIKSIAHEAWKELVRPQPTHILQNLFYWLLLQRKGYSVPDTISILYVTKGYLFGSPYKELTFKPEKEVHRLDPYIQEVKVLKDFRNKVGPMPPRTICSSIDCATAKSCHVAPICFRLP